MRRWPWVVSRITVKSFKPDKALGLDFLRAEHEEDLRRGRERNCAGEVAPPRICPICLDPKCPSGPKCPQG